jgi:nitronate monooxygenase
MTRAGVAGALAAGAAAAQLGTAFLLAPEAGTHDVHRRALQGDADTALTRAFTGRSARGIVNRFMREHHDAPRAYPEVHNLTAPLRAAAREQGDPEAVNLWAGQGYRLARELPAAELVRELSPR